MLNENECEHVAGEFLGDATPYCKLIVFLGFEVYLWIHFENYYLRFELAPLKA